MAPVFAGQPDSSQYPSINKQWIAEQIQVADEQQIEKSDMLRQLVLSIIEDVGWTKSLLWIAMFPMLTMAGVVFGFLKFFKRQR